LIRLQDITIGQYADRDSLVHRLVPRTKVILCFCLMCILLTAQGVTALFCFLGIVLTLFPLSKLSLRIALKNCRPFILLFILTISLHSFFTPGRLLWKMPLLNIRFTQEGIYQGVFYAVRIGILILLASLLTLTTAPMSLTDAIERFLSPFRRIGLPAHEIALMISISLRFIPTLIEEADRIRKAQLARGSRFDGSLIRRIQSIIPIIIPLFISTFRRANELAVAMDARCYRGGEGRTQYHILKFRKLDFIAISVVILLGAGVIIKPIPQLFKI